MDEVGLSAKVKWKDLTREQQKARVAAWRSRSDFGAAYAAEWRRLIELGLVTGFPNRLAWSEPMVERARREIAWMKDLDERFEAFKADNPEADVPASNGDRFRSLTNKSMDVFDKILSADLPMVEENAKLIREQREAAAVTIRIGARVALEMYKGQSIGALQALLEKMKAVGSPVIDETAVEGQGGDGGSGEEPGAVIEGEVVPTGTKGGADVV